MKVPQWNIDKDKVFHRISCKPSSPGYTVVDQHYQALLKELKKMADPLGIYKYKKRGVEDSNEGIDNCSYVVYCFVSIGKEVSDRIQHYFEIGSYLKATVLDAMADEMLFSISEEVTNHVFSEAKERLHGLTYKIEPGQRDIPLRLQKEIIMKLNEGEENLIEVKITEGFMLDPLKSMTFMYGADKNLPLTLRNHDCGGCSRKNCQFRFFSSKMKLLV
ncbi:putative vitamin B12 dependent methionine synthase [Clostridium aceticum]|uniref:Putative vitamin B12 dependent methionine synthase n=2 Tax=Clostridium aceticum TaxID=84022 RepID=A0A0G3WBF7_9CLOT|nr:hypothetical protein [Clostridium aceticum]AKL94774.1 putative vitamin B12 dependent methionine synthase [Clostridium aceticum]